VTVTTRRRRLIDIIPMEERPCCPYCGKKLRPDTSFLVIEGTADEKPSIPRGRPAEMVRAHWAESYRWDRVYKVEWTLQQWWLHFWTGEFTSYCELFCTYNCGVLFAAAAFKAGYRMERTCPHTGRD